MMSSQCRCLPQLCAAAPAVTFSEKWKRLREENTASKCVLFKFPTEVREQIFNLTLECEHPETLTSPILVALRQNVVLYEEALMVFNRINHYNTLSATNDFAFSFWRICIDNFNDLHTHCRPSLRMSHLPVLTIRSIEKLNLHCK